MKDDSPKRGAPLPGRADASESGGPYHHLEVSTFVDDEGIVAAELQYRLPEPEKVERNVTCEMCDNFASIIG